MNEIEKNRLGIFIAVAYGIPAIMSIFMFIGMKKGIDLTMFVNTQMLYPACGVILGMMIARNKDESLPLGGFITTLVLTAILMICSIGPVITKDIKLPIPGMEMSLSTLIGSLIMTVGSFVAYVLFWVCGKKKREDTGLARKNIKMSILMILLFLVLYILRFVISATLSNALNGDGKSLQMLKDAVVNPRTFMLLAVLVPNFVFTFIAFFGEEYGWRFYLLPVMIKKFGLRKGVLLLGIVWAFWHINIDFMFYSVETGPLMFVGQIITCITVGIFFAYAYLKTQNIMVPVIMHYMNNNLIVVLAGGDTSILQNQVVHARDLPIMVIQGLVFALFIFAPIFGKIKKERVEQ